MAIAAAALDGVRRWVTRRMPDAGVPAGPRLAEVLFDPALPADEKSIFVAVQRDPAASDWLPSA